MATFSMLRSCFVLVTAGLLLVACGEDEASPTCESACSKMVACAFAPDEELCVEDCRERGHDEKTLDCLSNMACDETEAVGCHGLSFAAG